MPLINIHKFNFRSIIVVIAALAMMIRAFVPAGWMYASDAEDGHVRIQMCPGHWVNWNPNSGQTTQIKSSGDQEHQDDDGIGSKCPYAVTAEPILGIASYTVASSTVWTTLIILPPNIQPNLTRSNQAQLPARGPPHSA